ncbi:hypothetical protein EGW08_014029, partial [Elysia chlorotica]
EAAKGSSCSKLCKCTRRITECTTFLEIIANQKILYDMCRKVRGVRRCIKKHEKSCPDEHIRYDAKAVLDVLDYMCSGRGRKLISMLSDSQCAEDLMGMEITVLDCIDEFEVALRTDDLDLVKPEMKPAPYEFCPYVEELDHCLIQGTYWLCGDDWGTFVADVWRIFSRDEMADYGCTNRHIRLRRSTSMARSMLSGKSR